MNTTMNQPVNSNNASVSIPKKVVYTETLAKKIIKDIQAGATFDDLRNWYNVKTMTTISRFLDRYYTKKKKVRDDVYQTLKDNNRNAMTKLTNKPKVVAPTPAPLPKVTFEDWWGSYAPTVDVLIDSTCSSDTIQLAKRYCQIKGLSFDLSDEESRLFLNIQAILLGKPKVITTSPDKIKYLKTDSIEFIKYTDLLSIYNDYYSETTDDESILFARKEQFKSLKRGKNGIISGSVSELENEFRLLHSLSSLAKLEIYSNNSRKNFEILGLKEGGTLTFISIEGGTTTAWKYRLEKGTFYEYAYYKGGHYVKKIVLNA